MLTWRGAHLQRMSCRRRSIVVSSAAEEGFAPRTPRSGDSAAAACGTRHRHLTIACKREQEHAAPRLRTAFLCGFVGHQLGQAEMHQRGFGRWHPDASWTAELTWSSAAKTNGCAASAAAAAPAAT